MKSAKTTKTVKLSIVVGSLYSPANLKNCLDSLLRQVKTICHSERLNAGKSKDDKDLKVSKTTIGQLQLSATAGSSDKIIEIIVADCCLKNSFSEWTDKYPEVGFVQFSQKATLPVLLSAGIARAKGEIIAITDSSCVSADNWVASILEAHRAESPVIGGAVEMLEDDSKLTDWAAYFCDYGQFMRPAPRGVVTAVPGNNLSIKRWALAKGAEFIENEFWKTHWCRQLQAEGIELFSEPAILVHCRKTYRLIPFLRRRFHQGRSFAGIRVNQTGVAGRAIYAFGSTLLPILFLFRTVSPIFRKGRFFGKLLLSLPVIMLAIIFWSVGETIGYLAGAGNSCKRV
jgi:hypothetical protein